MDSGDGEFPLTASEVLLCPPEAVRQSLGTHIPLDSYAFSLFLSHDPCHFLPGTAIFYILVFFSLLNFPLLDTRIPDQLTSASFLTPS